jgi:hypothetical protein
MVKIYRPKPSSHSFWVKDLFRFLPFKLICKQSFSISKEGPARELSVAGSLAIDTSLSVTGQKALVDINGSLVSEINITDQTGSATVTNNN